METNEKLEQDILEENAAETETTPQEEEKSTESPQVALEAMNDKYLRLNAEFQNYKRRVEKEKSDLVKYGTERLVEDLLPIIDNFGRALAVETADEKLIEGLGMIQKSLEEFMSKNGVKKIEAKGEAFDPQKHHAVMTEAVEGCDSEIVVDVLQEGYTLNDKVIRPSMVKVSC